MMLAFRTQDITRWTATTFLVLLVSIANVRLALAQSWLLVPPMSAARALHTATLLQDGRVLIAGGNQSSGSLKGAEIYNPTLGSWTTVSPMNTGRYNHSATLLADGRVLVAGGWSGTAATDTAEIYDVTTNTWTPVSFNMGSARSSHTATLLQNGKVLLTGGFIGGSVLPLKTALIFDPTAPVGVNPWTTVAVPDMATARWGHTATLLSDGNVLVSGGSTGLGFTNNVQIYDAVANNWTTVSNMNNARDLHQAILVPGLSGDQVLVVGGRSSIPSFLNSAEIYSVSSGTWTPVSNMNVPRYGHIAVLLDDGRVMVSGGNSNGTVSGFLASTEIYDPTSGAWTSVANMNTARQGHRGILVSNHHVLVTGGSNGTGFVQTAEIFSPQTDQTIAFGPLPNRTYGDASFTVSATASSGLPVTFSSAGSCSVLGNTVTIIQAGNCTITANQGGNIFWNPAPPVSQSFTIFKATPVITWSNPATIVYGTPLDGTQLSATANVSGTFTYTPPAGTVLNASNGQILHVDFTPADTANYNNASKDVSINVSFAKAIVIWDNPADIVYGTALDGTQLNATANVSGTFTYTPPAGTVLNAGTNQILQVIFQPDSPNYVGKELSVTINVEKAAAKLILGSPIGDKGFRANVGDPAFVASALSNSPAPVIFTAGPPEVCTSSGSDGSTITLVGFGACTVTASQDETANYTSGFASASFYVNGRPAANAGVDQTVNESTLVVLDGTASQDPEGDSLTYTWTQVAGSPVALDLTVPAHPVFTAPSVTYLQDGSVLTFQLVVTDGQVDSLPATVNVTVKNVNKIPVAYALAAATVNEGSPGVLLDGTTSYDPDGEPLIYAWLQTAGPTVTLLDPSSANPTFGAPFVGQAGALLTFDLTVTDPVGASSVASVSVQVENVNHPPVASAGNNQTVNESTLVTIDGTGSSDPDNDPLTYAWSQDPGDTVTVALSNANVSKPTFTAPAVGPGGATLRFNLTVNDGLVSSSASQVAVTVQNVNDPPACNLAQPSVAVLWPPNHKLIPVKILGVSDPNSDRLTISITGVTQDEPVNGLGDGDTSPDAVIQGSQVLLRAERAEKGNGRLYRVAFTADDGNGGICSGSVSVSVPPSKKRGVTAIDDGQLYDSTQKVLTSRLESENESERE